MTSFSCPMTRSLGPRLLVDLCGLLWQTQIQVDPYLLGSLNQGRYHRRHRPVLGI